MTATADPTAIDTLSAGLELEELALGNGHAHGNGNGEAVLEAIEPTIEAVDEAADLQVHRPIVAPIHLLKRARGRYRGRVGGFEAELRVDTDGSRPQKRASGDFFSITGATTRYFGSWAVDAPTITTTSAQVVVDGQGRFTWAASSRRVRVTAPRRSVFSHTVVPAKLEFLNASGAVTATYPCAFESSYFRSVQLEQDSVAGTVPFVSYDTASLLGPDPDRVLTVPKAFQEAGLDVQVAGTVNVVPVSAAGSPAPGQPAPTWSDSELHNAMVNHFSLHADAPQWRVWMLTATAHDGGYRGIMFDYSGSRHRQGAAVFYDAIKGTDAASQRAALRTYVHEIGHAFNLLHSWDKQFADPPQPLGPNGGLGDLSWMNYAWKYNDGNGSAGEAAYWSAFGFAFTDNELVHLRHGFRDSVVMGGSEWTVGAGDVDPGIFAEPAVDASGFALELRAKPAFMFGEPVVVELKLATTDTRGRSTHGYLHPQDDFTTIAIRQPSGRCVIYRPLMRHCVDVGRDVRVAPDTGIYDSAYIGFGADGFLFDGPGEYQLRAQHILEDGSRIVSPVIRLRMRTPLTAEDEAAGELLLGREQGQLLALLGSDAVALQSGNDAVGELLDRHGDHPLAVYGRLLQGVNANRAFKDLTPQKELVVRDARPAEAVALLSEVEAASKNVGEGVDNVTLNMVMREHAIAEALQGHSSKAAGVLDAMPKAFAGRGVREAVIDEVVRPQAEAAKEALPTA